LTKTQQGRQTNLQKEQNDKVSLKVEQNIE